MDRQISKEVKKKEQRKQIIKFSVIGIVIAAAILFAISQLQTTLKQKDITFSVVDRGTIEVSVSASGKVVPAFEEIINTPIESRILEVYKKGGDAVDVGTPVLKLDLQSAETEYKKQLDEEKMKEYLLEQKKVESAGKLSDIKMKMEVSQMRMNRLLAEYKNEQYLDSLGAGTTDKVRQAELAYNVGRLEYEQYRQEYANTKEITAADLRVKELELNIFRKSLAETRRTLDDARICSPRKAVLTYVNTEVGARVPAGTKVAVVSDLSHFKIEGEIADTYGDRIAAGSKVIVKIGNDRLVGNVSDVTPLSKNGVISFTVRLDDDQFHRLRSGLKTDVYVMNAVKEEVLRIANSSYYMGKGEYDLFVTDGEGSLRKRKVVLGDSNFEYVEVVSGLNAGDKVVVSDMKDFKNKKKLKYN
ncbi:MAG: HlyD family efflux transporter periplasmic adaptor subunit [Parabacteroides sp.]|nr:HlyD family efflux transporter periplasmic adaptor subunit [Parabacteroides sp.]